MMEDRYSHENKTENRRVPEARYAYYRRCQVFRKGGEQCKAPAEKGSEICYAHAGQQAMALRRERERQAVLAEAVAEMRRRGRPEFEAQDLFTDFTGIQVTLEMTARALIDGRINCKTAGRLLVQLQTMSKLLWMIRKSKSTTEARRHGEKPRLPQICADERRFSKATELPELFVMPEPPTNNNFGWNWAANECEETRIALLADTDSTASQTGLAHGPPWRTRAA
jgi:hypothetical protein